MIKTLTIASLFCLLTSVSYSQFWGRDTSTGTLYPATISDNVGIGIYDTKGFKLAVSGNGKFGGNATFGRSGNNYDEYGYNIGFTATNNQYTYLVDNYASSIRFGNQGGIEFRTAPLGTSGAPLTLTNRMIIKEDGRVGIGTISPDEMLTVKGKIHTQEVRVDLAGAVGPDYVFEESYKLLSLEEVEALIKANKHLPEIPSAKELEEDGLNLKEMNLLLLKKIEELTLYTIELNKVVKSQAKDIDELKGGLPKADSSK